MGEAGRLDRWLGKVVQVRPGEAQALLWSFFYFFFLLGSYYVLRPLRDEMGIIGGVKTLPWMFTATFISMLAVVPLFGAVVAWLPRRRFIPLVYNFFVANIAIFWVLLTFKIQEQVIARVFFVWITAFSVFTVSVFWSFMADLYRSEQSKRLYGFIAAGGSIGGLVGPIVTVWLAKPLGPINLLIIAAVLLEGAVLCANRLEKAAATPAFAKTDAERDAQVAAAADRKLGGNWLAGLALIFRSPYLGGIALWVFLLSLAGTFLYLMQAEIVAGASGDSAERTRIFASIDLAAGLLTILFQLFATGRLITRFGVGVAAAVTPMVFVAGYGLLAAVPALGLVIGLQALQRTANFAISNPARETLFTVVSREEKYKAKNVIDGVVFRGADMANAWLFALLQNTFGLMTTGVALVAAPIAAGWLVLALALGREQARRAGREDPIPATQREGA